jgi:TonB family protein
MSIRFLALGLSVAFVATLRAAPLRVDIGKMGPDSQQPRVISQARPQYPVELRNAGIGGTAVVDFIVDVNGRVQNARVVDVSNVEFGPAALAAIVQWQFTPGLIHGHPVEVHMQIPVVFSIDGKGAPAAPPSLPPEPLPAAAEIFNVAHVDRQPIPVYQVRPIFPADLRAAGTSGTATIDFIVDRHGVVAWSRVYKASAPEFGAAAQAAVVQWRFKPALKQSQPVFVHLIVPFNFSIN